MRKLPSLIEAIAAEVSRLRPHLRRRQVVNQAYAFVALSEIEQRHPEAEHLLGARVRTVRTELGRALHVALPEVWDEAVPMTEEALAEGRTAAEVVAWIRGWRTSS